MVAVMAAKNVLARAVNGSSNSTILHPGGPALFESFIFRDSKSVRTSTVILASFNVLAAFATAARILYDCYWASKRSSRNFKASKLFILSIHPAETFPLVLSLGIFIQGLIFAGVQGTGLKSLNITGCGTIAQFMWPALFIVPFIQAVFGVECALRSLRPKPFRPRGKYDVAICCGLITLMLIGTWVYSHVVREPNLCFASLVWYISRYGEETLILLSVSTGLIMFSTIIIFIRLSMATLIDKQQRIAASRIVYYNVLGLVSLGFVIPYFVSQTVSHGNIKLSMMATVVLNLSGLMGGLLKMLLRSKTSTIAFEMKSVGPWRRARNDAAMSSFNDRAFNKQLASPLSEQPAPVELDTGSESIEGVINAEKGRAVSMESLESFPFESPVEHDPLGSKAAELDDTLPGISDAVTASLPGPAKRTHVRKQSYSLFPGNAASPVKATPPAIHIEPTSKYSTQIDPTNDADELKPPPPIHFGHRRDSSVVSSATVQIGLRISQAPQSQDVSAPHASIPSTSYNPGESSPTSPLSPKLIPISFSFRPGSPPPPTSRPPKGPSPLRTNTLSTQPSPGPVDSNKTLPPTPKASGFNFSLPKVRINSTQQLSPVAYSPQKKAASPRSAAPPPTTSPRRAPLPLSPRPVQPNMRPEPRLQSGPGSREGWI